MSNMPANKNEVQHPQITLGALTANSPAALTKGASAIANELANMIKTQKLSVNIQGREYVRVEGWTTLSTLMGVMPREVDTVEKDGVYVSTVELVRMNDGMTLSRASAECGHDSPWNKRPKYARRSMAQTRATGKACRLAFSWIMGLAGYATTPFEEIEDIQPQNGHSQAAQSRPKQSPTQRSGRSPGAQQSGAQGPTEKQLGLLNQQIQLLGYNDRDQKLQYVNGWLRENGYSEVKSSKDIPRKAISNLIDHVKTQVAEVAPEQEVENAYDQMDETPY